MSVFDIFKKKDKSSEIEDDEYQRYLKLMQDISEDKVSQDLLNTDPSKKSITSEDLRLIIKYGQL